MKKILSILICVVLGISSAWAANGATKLHAYAILGSTYEEGGAKVTTRASNADGRIGRNEISGTQHRNTYSSVQGSGYCGSWITNGYDLYATYESIQTGYFFSGWYSKTNDTYNKISTDIEYHKGYGGCEGDGTLTIYAIFQPITVTGYTVNNISISDINTAGQGSVVFNVTNSSDVDVNDFDYNITGEGFSIVNKSYASGKLTVTVQYTSQTTDNVNGDPKPDLSATVTLTSKGDNSSSQTATIKANVSLVPTFSIAPTSYSFFDEYGIIANNESKTKTLTVTTTNKAAAVSTYTYSLSDAVSGSTTFSGASNPYTIDASNPLQPVVKFTAPASGYYEDVTCTLTVYCTYTDAQSKQIVSETKTVTLTADAGSAIKIDNTMAVSHDFGTTIYGTGASVSLPFTATVAYTAAWDPSNIFTHSISGSNITVNVPTTLVPGDYTSELQFIYEGNKVASLTATTKVRLATPSLNAKAYMGQALLTWLPVYGADSYILEQDGVQIATFAAGESTYSHMATNLTSEQQYVYKLTAVYNADNQYNTFIEQSVTPGAAHSISAGDLPYLQLYTGTEIFVEGHATYGKFPYSPKRKIDLSAAFDASGNALFDELYVFGLTTSGEALVQNGKAGHKVLVPNRNADPANVATTDAIVPCYIYKKINATTYGNLTVVANMNQKAKQIANIKANNQKVYFTGYCPIGSTGFTTGHYGVVCFEQDGEKTLDVYLDNLELHARSQTQGGAGIAKTLSTDTIQKELLKISEIDVSKIDLVTKTLNLNVVQYLESSAAAFAIAPTSTSTVFRPTIHLRGENRLNSASGLIKVTVELLGKSKPAGQYSSPLHIVTTNANHAAIVAIDDIWPKTNNTTEAALNSPVRTNGGLNLSSTVGGSPSIDLGNAKSGVQFNGGRVRLKNATPSSGSYTVTYAISCRSYNQSASVSKSLLGMLVTVNADITLCGMGDDLPDGTVEFNDGTFYSEAISTSSFNTYRSFYHTRNCVKAPIKTTVNGGSYYCDIFAASGPKNPGASPKNRYGDGVVLDTIAIDSKTEPYQTANITFPNEKPVRDDFTSTYPSTLGAYYTAKGSTYNTNSMQAYEGLQQPDSVVLMIPYQYTDKELWEDIRVKNWVMCVPQMGLVTTIDGEETTMSIAGEDVAYVDSVVMDGLPVKTQYLLYAEYDPYIAEAVSSDYYLPDVGLGDENAVELQGDFIQSLKNKGDYQIQTAQYILKPVRGDEWMVFSPPFDVTNVYVLESYPEELLKEMDPYDALIQQAKANIDYLFYPAYYLYINDPAQNFWSFQNLWKANKKLTKGKGAIKLNHFTGTNYDANYYLQCSSGNWGWDETKGKFVTNWEYLPATPEKVTHGEGTNAKEYTVIMKKGGLYSMKFPYMYHGYREEGGGNWDYWTGKYIIFEGLGSQTLNGKQYHATAGANKPNNVAAVLRGNATFSDMSVQQTNAYYLDITEGKQIFKGPNSQKTTVQPLSGFVLAEGNPRNMPNRQIAIDMMTGDVTYEQGDGSENTVTGTPTIAGEREMLVYTVAGGLGVVPVVPQHVSIYNAAGQLVVSQYLTDNTQFALPTGIYLVRGEKDQAKAMVK